MRPTNPYLNTAPTKLRRDWSRETDRQKRKQMADALMAWRMTQPGPFRRRGEFDKELVAAELATVAGMLVADTAMVDTDTKKLAMGIGNAVGRAVGVAGLMNVRRKGADSYLISWSWPLGGEDMDLWLHVWKGGGPVVIDYGYRYDGKKVKEQVNFWGGEPRSSAVKDLTKAIGKWLDRLRADRGVERAAQETDMDTVKIASELTAVARELTGGASVQKTFACGSAGYCSLRWVSVLTFDKSLDELKPYSDAVASAAGRDMKAIPRMLEREGAIINMRSHSRRGPVLLTTAGRNLPTFEMGASLRIPEDEDAEYIVRKVLKQFKFEERKVASDKTARELTAVKDMPIRHYVREFLEGELLGKALKDMTRFDHNDTGDEDFTLTFRNHKKDQRIDIYFDFQLRRKGLTATAAKFRVDVDEFGDESENSWKVGAMHWGLDDKVSKVAKWMKSIARKEGRK